MLHTHTHIYIHVFVLYIFACVFVLNVCVCTFLVCVCGNGSGAMNVCEQDEKAVDDIITRLLDVRNGRPGKQVRSSHCVYVCVCVCWSCSSNPSARFGHE